MCFEELLSSLNESQKKAATYDGGHLSVLAGAGCGKTKTIVAHACYLISKGVKPQRIKVLTFTRRAASVINERVKNVFDKDMAPDSSTYHSWCTSIIKQVPKLFGYISFSIIDQDDQNQIFKILRGKKERERGNFPEPSKLRDIYSYMVNTMQNLSSSIKAIAPDAIEYKAEIAQIIKGYQEKKAQNDYIDYDDVLAFVAQELNKDKAALDYVSSHYDYILVDEMQDTNPLQWKLLEPLAKKCTLFCVGDDAQSIYGFRGADFQNVHDFQKRLPDSAILRLEDNYRSTQEILDLSNWLLQQSPINYEKNLHAVRGKGNLPQLHTFDNKYDEASWIAEDLLEKFNNGDAYGDNMVLSRSLYDLRALEASLLEKDIPYRVIGGSNLLEAAHVKDLISLLRVFNNYQDEIAWMRYLDLWEGVGQVTATKLTEIAISVKSYKESIKALEETQIASQKKDYLAPLQKISTVVGNVSNLIKNAFNLLEGILCKKFKNQDWNNRKRDFEYLEKLGEKYTSLFDFLCEYTIDPIYNSAKNKIDNTDVVTLITVHSAKGTEKKNCYVIELCADKWPSIRAVGNENEVEEERRVLYVALTRARDNLIMTRQGSVSTVQKSIIKDNDKEKVVESYFLNNLPQNLVKEFVHTDEVELNSFDIQIEKRPKMQIELDLS